MGQGPSWKANRFSATQEITHILWNPKVHYHFNKSPLPIPTRSQIKPFFVTSHLLILFNIFLPSTSGSYTWTLSLRVSHQKPVRTFPLPYTYYRPRPSNTSLFRHPNNIWWGVKIIKFLVMWSSPLPYYLVPFRPKYFLVLQRHKWIIKVVVVSRLQMAQIYVCLVCHLYKNKVTSSLLLQRF
jgi:hypothetical protein